VHTTDYLFSDTLRQLSDGRGQRSGTVLGDNDLRGGKAMSGGRCAIPVAKLRKPRSDIMISFGAVRAITCREALKVLK
jgi:hypothetical protein